MTCVTPDYFNCVGNGNQLPDDFCCSASPSTYCLALASYTSLLCCPTGDDCSAIAPITCDISEQNVTLHPNNNLKTSNLTGSLPACGTSCCPFGYTCGSGVCSIDPGFRVMNLATSSTTSAAAAAAATATSSKPPSSTVSFSSISSSLSSPQTFSATSIATATSSLSSLAVLPSGDSVTSPIPTSGTSSASPSKFKTAPVVPIAITLSLLLASLLIGFASWYWRRREGKAKRRQERWDNAELSAEEIKRRFTLRFELPEKAMAGELAAEDVKRERRYELSAKSLPNVPFPMGEAVELPATPLVASRSSGRGAWL